MLLLPHSDAFSLLKHAETLKLMCFQHVKTQSRGNLRTTFCFRRKKHWIRRHWSSLTLATLQDQLNLCICVVSGIYIYILQCWKQTCLIGVVEDLYWTSLPVHMSHRDTTLWFLMHLMFSFAMPLSTFNYMPLFHVCVCVCVVLFSRPGKSLWRCRATKDSCRHRVLRCPWGTQAEAGMEMKQD